MTSSIDDSQDLRAPASPSTRRPAGRTSNSRLIRGVQIFTSAAALTGVGALTGAFIINEWRIGVIGFTFVIGACVAGAVLVANALVADRQEFYQRGKADGWYEGWRGVPPSSDDPLLRH